MNSRKMAMVMLATIMRRMPVIERDNDEEDFAGDEESNAKVTWSLTSELENKTVEVEAEEDKFEMDGLKLKIKNIAEENLGIYR